MADPEFYADDDAGGGGGGEDPELLAELREMMKAAAQGSVETQRGSDDEDRELLAEYEALAASVGKASGSIEPPPSYEAVTVKPPSAQVPDSVEGNSSEKVAHNSGKSLQKPSKTAGESAGLQRGGDEEKKRRTILQLKRKLPRQRSRQSRPGEKMLCRCEKAEAASPPQMAPNSLTAKVREKRFRKTSF